MVGHVGDGNFHAIIGYDPIKKVNTKKSEHYQINLLIKL